MKSKLNGGNLVQQVNTWAVSLLRNSAAFISWRKFELQANDRKTRKLFTICGELSDVDRFYIPRKDGGRGLIAFEDCVEFAVRGLEVYVHGNEERLLQGTRGNREDGLEAKSILKKVKKEKKIGRRKLYTANI